MGKLIISTHIAVDGAIGPSIALIKGDLAESVTSLRHQHRGNVLSFGCGELAYELASQGLADEIHF
jgi:hypothetical protein